MDEGSPLHDGSTKYATVWLNEESANVRLDAASAMTVLQSVDEFLNWHKNKNGETGRSSQEQPG